MKNTTIIYLKVEYEDWLVMDDKLTEFIDGARGKIGKALSLPSENVKVEKIIQENPLWVDQNMESAEA